MRLPPVSENIRVKVRKLFHILLIVGASIFVFWLVFGLPGRELSRLVQSGLGRLIEIVPSPVREQRLFILHDLAYNGLLPIVVTFLGFLPQLLILFICLEVLKRFRISDGIVPFMTGFGCTMVAVSTIGTMKKGGPRNLGLWPTFKEKQMIERQKARVLLLSFIPCSAKIPVLLIFVTGFFQFSFLTIYLLYALATVTGLGVYWIYCRTKGVNLQLSKKVDVKKDEQKEKICSSMKRVIFQVLSFFRRLSFPILISAMIIYFSSHYTFSLRYTAEIQNSILYQIANFVAPLFTYVGLGNAVIITVLVLGLLGKEMIASSLAIIGSAVTFTQASALAFLTFVMLYPACLNTFFTIRKKIGIRFAFFVAGINLAVAYVMAGFMYWFW
ncbi:MAG: hypothetical protein FWE01_02470 [Firmicutes bacterium]|nr:hypothetical protein [Bacillota bacterium]